MREEVLIKNHQMKDDKANFNNNRNNSMSKNMKKNIAITGKRQVGKTTLLKQFLRTHSVEVAGYQTIPYQLDGVFSGYEMVNLRTKEKRAISVKQKDGSFHAVVETFDQFGVNLLRDAILSDSDVVMLDEIGRFERTSNHFIAGIHQALDSEKFVLTVLKKEPIEFIEKIKKREDIVIIDLDEISYENAYQVVEEHYFSFQQKMESLFKKGHLGKQK